MDPRNDNAPNPEDVLLKLDDQPWLPFSPGVDYKLCRLDPVMGVWTIMIRMDDGGFFPPHKHLGAGEFYMVKGKLAYRAGSAEAGDYGYEPNGVYHEATTAVGETELLFTNHGAIAFLNEDDSVAMVLDWEFFRDNPNGVQLPAEQAAE